MDKSWNTFGLFETLLNDFGSAIHAGENEDEKSSRLARAIAIAKVGFSRFMPITAWTPDEDAYIDHLLQGDLSQESMEEGYEECADAIFVYDCFAFGALHGKFLADEIDEPGHLLGAMQLSAFLGLNEQEICDKYTVVLGSSGL